ncbi:hypothetical protein FF1_001456 [Malus domestica]
MEFFGLPFRTMLLVAFLYLAFVESLIRHYNFSVVFKSTTNLCSSKPIVTVNGKFPGPALYAREDYTVIVKVTNHVNHSVTIHWHGVKQLGTGRRGTLLWHAHDSWLRAALHDDMVILPKRGSSDCARYKAVISPESHPTHFHGIPRFIVSPIPSIWFLHCHLEVHTTWGLKMAFTVENGEGPNEFMSPPPTDLPTFWIFRPERLSN